MPFILLLSCSALKWMLYYSIADGCLSHKSGLGIAIFGIYTNYLLEHGGSFPKHDVFDWPYKRHHRSVIIASRTDQCCQLWNTSTAALSKWPIGIEIRADLWECDISFRICLQAWTSIFCHPCFMVGWFVGVLFLHLADSQPYFCLLISLSYMFWCLNLSYII